MPDPVDSAYLAALRAARDRANVLRADTLTRIRQALEHAARALEFDLAGGDTAITAERAASLSRQIRGLLASLELTVARAIERGVALTVEDVVALHRGVVDRLARRFLGSPIAGLSQAFDVLQLRPLLLVASRPQNAATFRTLLNRHALDAAPALDTLLESAIARGVSTRRLTRDVAELLTHAIPPPAGRYGLDYADVSGLGTIRSDAERIAVSETLNALREANARSMAVSPIILAAKWQRSGRHSGLPSSPDECDLLAELDFYGYGPGMYPPEFWPFAGHPLCGCTQGGPTIFRDPSEWGTPRPPAPALLLMPERIDFAVVGVDGVEAWSEARQVQARIRLRLAIRRQVPGVRRAA